MNINNLFAGMGLNPSGVTGGSSSDSGNSSGSPQDIPKEELMNLCMKMNKRMQAMETKGKELVRKKALLLSERHRLLELMKTVMPVPVLSKEDSDLDIDTVERNWAEFENTRKNHTIAMEEKLLKKEQTAQQDIAALEARFRRQIADLQSGTAVADGSTSGTSDSTTNVTPKVGLNEDVEKDLMMAKQSLQEYQQRVVKADCEVERLRSAESVWKQQGHSMEAVIADKNNELDQLHKSYQASKTALEEKVVALQLQINNAKHQGAEKEELLSSNRSQTEKLNGQIAALQRLIEEKDLSNKSNKDMIAALQARLIELEPELAQARDRVSQQERNAQASRVMKAEQDALSESLRRDLKNSLEEAEASRRRINELEEYKVKAEGQLLKLASLTETVATMQSSVDEKESLLVRLRAEQATAERNHAMRTAMLATAEARLEQATNDLAAKDNTIQEVVDRVAALQTQLSTSEARLQERVAAAAQERSELEQQLSGLEETSLSMRKSMQQQFAEELEALNRDHAKKSSMARTLLSEREEEVRVLSTKNLQLTEEIQSGAPQERRIFELAQTQSRREALHGVHGDTRELAFQQIQCTLANRDLDLARAHQVLSSLQKEVVDLRRTHKRDGINMDYLKNIVIQYMTFPVNSSEKMSLVPVLAMLLQFTPKELAQVQRAQLENPVHSSPSIWSPFGLGGGGGTSAASISSLTSSSTPKEIGRKLTTSAAAGSSSSSASASGAGAAGGGGPGRVMSGPALTASALAAAHAKASSKAYASTTGAGAGASFYQTPQANKLRTNSSVSNASTSSSNQSDGGGEGQHFTQQYPQHTHTTSSKQHYDINNNIVSPITATPASPATGTAAAARGGGGGGGGVIGGETIHIGSYNPHTNNSALMIETAEGEDINSTASEFSTPVHSGGRAANAANIAHINHHASNPNDSAIYHLSSGSASRSTSQQSGFGFIGITTSTTTAHSANINNTNNVDNDDGGSAAMELMSESQAQIESKAAAADRGIVLHHHNTRSYHGDSMNSLTSMSSKSHSGKYTPPTLTAVAGNANNNNNNNNNNGHHWETSTQVQEGKTGDAEGAEEDVLIEVDAPRTSSATKLFNQGADAVHSVAKQGVQGIAKEGARTAEYAAKGALRGVLEATRALELLTFGAYYRVSSTAFVTFKSRQAKCSSHQMLLSHEYYGIKVTPAPNPRDIVWENVSIPESQISIRTSIADGVLIVGALFWSLVVTFISAISNMQQISQVIPVLQNYSNTVIYQFLNNYLAIGLLLVLLAVLPYLFDFIARSYEGIKTESEIQNSIMTRYFYYQLANVYVSLGLGSVATSLHEILSNPSNILSILGTSVPSFSIYFANLMIIKTLTAVPVEMLRVFPLLEVLSVTTCMDKKKCTRRELRTGCFADPPMLYGWIYPNLMMVLMIMLTYCCIAPFLMPLCALFFALAYLMYKYQLLYVYINEEQSGGFMWYAVFNRSMVVLLAGVCTLLCYLAIRMTFISGPFYLLLPLPFLIVLFWHHCDKRIKAPAMTLSLEGALELDRGTKDSEARGESTPHDQFTNTCYRQPALAEGKLRPALYRQNKPVLPEVERGPAPYDLMMHSFSGRTYDLASGRGGAADPYTNQRNSNSSRRVRGTSVASITELSDADEDGDGDEDPESDRGPRGGGAGGGRKVFASSLDVFEDPSGASASQDSDGGGGRGSGGGGMGAAAAGSWVGDVRSTLVPLQVTPARSSAGAGAGAGAGGSAGGGGVLTPLSESATPLAAAASSRTPTGRTATVPPAVATHRGLPPTHPPSSRSPTHGGRGASSGGGGGSSMQNHFGIEDVTSVSVSMEDEEEEEEDGDVSTVAELENDEMVDSEDDAPDMEHAIHELLEDESSKHHHPQQQPIPFPANTPTGAGAGARRSQSMSYAASSSTTTTVSPLADHRGDLESAGQQQGGGVVQYLRHPTVADINRGGYAINSQTKPEDQQRGEHSVNNSSVSGGSPPGNYYNFNYGATGHTPPPPPAATTGSTGAAGVTVTAEDDATASASASASHPHISSRRSRHRTSVAALALSSLTAGGGGDDDSNDDDDEVSRAVVGGRNIRNKQL